MVSRSRYVRTVNASDVCFACVPPGDAADVVAGGDAELPILPSPFSFDDVFAGGAFTTFAGPKNSKDPLPLNTAQLVRGAGSAACLFICALEGVAFTCPPGTPLLVPAPTVAVEPIAVCAASETEERLVCNSA